MGLFKSIKKTFKRNLKPVLRGIAPTLPGPLPGIIGGIIGGQIQPISPIPGIPPMIGGLPVPGGGRPPPLTRPLPRPPGGGLPIIPGVPGAACPAGFHPAKDGSGRCVRNRRMNVMNPRAARRAIRRIKGARKMLQSIERQLPKQRVRASPRGHRARLTHE